MTPQTESVGVIVIGRNEGERLVRCLDSLIGQSVGVIVYVDSGSTDGSVEMARSKGVVVESLDTSVPFTMARGRNAGFRRLLAEAPETPWVQFVDGDCEVDPSWIASGLRLLIERPDVSGVCGFRSERFPEASVYNRLANMEWRGPVGEITACGGDAMYRVEAFRQSGGFNERMIAGEEADLCARVRNAGGKLWRLDCPMTLHDAALVRFGQWWTRSVRGGHAFAEGFALHHSAHQRRRVAGALVYGMLLPCGLIGSGLLPSSLLRSVIWTLGVAAYSKSSLGAYRARRRLGDAGDDAGLYALFCSIGKLPEAQGVLTYAFRRLARRRASLIEYKS